MGEAWQIGRGESGGATGQNPRDSALAAPLLAVRGLSYRVGGKPLLGPLDFEIAAGRRTVILGANGAGKSLTVRLLHGLIRPTEGQILWQGAPLGPLARRQQAMVFQRPVLLRRSALANLRFALRARGVPRRAARERAWAALDQAHLRPLAHRPARLLSGGEQQRLALARALACRPRMLFLDEPTASLDPAATRAVEALILEAHHAGVTILLVTHDQGQARRLGQDGLFLHHGQLVETGPVADLLTRPRSAPAQAWVEGRLYL